MADFQFYRPQVNTLERLWSQYAEAEGSKGGAFLRGLAPGLEAMGKNISDQRKAKAAQDFEIEQTKKAQDFEASQTDIKLKAAETARYRDQIAADARAMMQLGYKSASETTEAAGKVNAEAAESAANVKAAEAILRGSGRKFQSDAELRQIATDLGSAANANSYVDNLAAADAAVAEEAQRKEEQRAAKLRRDTVSQGIDALQSSPFAKQIGGTLLQLRQGLEDPNQLEKVGARVEQLSGRMQLVDWAKNTVDQYGKVDLKGVDPTQREMIQTAMQPLQGAVSALSDKDTMAYYLSNDQAFDEQVKNIITARNALNNSLGGIGAESKFWQTEAEKGRGALRPQQPGQVVRLQGGVPVDLSPQAAAQLNEAVAQRVRSNPEFSVIMSSPAMVAMPLAGTAEELSTFMMERLSTSEADAMMKRLTPMLDTARREELESRGFKVLKNVQEDPQYVEIKDGRAVPTAKYIELGNRLIKQANGDVFKLQQLYRDENLYSPKIDMQVEQKRQALKEVSQTDYASKAQSKRSQVEKNMSEREKRIDQSMGELSPEVKAKGNVQREVIKMQNPKEDELTPEDVAVRETLFRLSKRIP